MADQRSIWAFDLGKGSMGEAVRDTRTCEFLHLSSLLLPSDLGRRGPAGSPGTPASRYRAKKTREAHRERERWLDAVWRAAGLLPLQARETWKNPASGKWELKHGGDFRLEREFPPPVGERTKDGAPSDQAGALTCYASSLLRIRLLQWRPDDAPLDHWQVYKALRSGLQRRGYGPVPWARKEARQPGGREDEGAETDPRYREAIDRWTKFKAGVSPEFQLPCYYDAFRMGLWRPEEPRELQLRPDHHANSTRNVRFDRADVRRELTKLGDQAAKMIPELSAAFAQWRERGWQFTHPMTGEELVHKVRARSFGEFLCDGPSGEPVEESFEAFLEQRHESGIRVGSFQEWFAALGQKTPRFDNRALDHCVLIPRFHACKVDARLETDGQGKLTGIVITDSLLAQEVTFLLKLKNILVADAEGEQRKLSVSEVRNIYRFARLRLASLEVVGSDGEPVKKWPQKVAGCFGLAKSDWLNVAAQSEFLKRAARWSLPETSSSGRRAMETAELLAAAVCWPRSGAAKSLPAVLEAHLKMARATWREAKRAVEGCMLRPLPGHEEVKPPKTTGRSAYSRVALRLLKELILSGKSPAAFHAQIMAADADLLPRLGRAPDQPLLVFQDAEAPDSQARERTDAASQKRGLLASELDFLLRMGKDGASADSWEHLFIPAQSLEALQQRHTAEGVLDADAAVRDLLGDVSDPIVRHRLALFDERLKKLRFGDAAEGIAGFGVPDAIVLEFVREDFMGELAKQELQRFQRERERERKAAMEEAADLGLSGRRSALKVQLFRAQGGMCLYTGRCLDLAKLDEYEIDHIVPRSAGGPDAMVNYALTFHDINHTKEKGKLTPYALLSGKEGWDAYLKRVESRRTALRNKKVQLLTRQDAADLVQRYTALAETAWISKLAQTILNLRFGWNNGCDGKGRRRVIVISGGLTARVRRKYGLDRLLYADATDPDVLARKLKNRADRRHHALDAMVLTFIPSWARDPDKQGFFRFPAAFRDDGGREDYERIRNHFERHLAPIVPRYLSYERPALADTIYGRRMEAGQTVMVQRLPVHDLAFKTERMKRKFDLPYAMKQIERIRDGRIRRELATFVKSAPDETGWQRACDELAAGRWSQLPDCRVKAVMVNREEKPAEFRDLSKDGAGAYRTRKGDHQGQFVFEDQCGRIKVRAVRVFESVVAIRSEVHREARQGGVFGFFRSRCLVELDQPVAHGTIILDPGIYRLNTIKQDGRAQLTSASGLKSPEISLRKLVAAGFRRKH